MTPEIISAIISASVAFIVGLIVSFQNKKQMFSSIVSRERMIWVREVREKAEVLFAICEQYESFAELPPEKKEAFLRAKNALILRLSPKGYHVLDDEIVNLVVDKSYEEIRSAAPKIRERLVLIAKTEWDKVKVEAGSSKKKIAKIKDIQEKLDSSHNTEANAGKPE